MMSAFGLIELMRSSFDVPFDNGASPDPMHGSGGAIMRSLLGIYLRGQMPVTTPTARQILEIASKYRLDLTEQDVADFRHIMEQTLVPYRRLDELPEPTLPVHVPRTPGYRPGAEENPCNGWYWKTDIASGKQDLLSGKRIAVKDNICVAGVPMM